MKRILNKSSNPAGFYPFLLLTVIIIAVYTLVIQAPAKNYTGLDKILKNGEITFITHKSYHTYYLYNGEPSGFEYDLAQMYADHIGVKLNFIITENWESILPQVTSGTADVAAAGLTVSVEREKKRHLQHSIYAGKATYCFKQKKSYYKRS
jgi:membrane-bound lytic murein transglycosylase F